MAQLRLRLLGRFELAHADGTRVHVPNGKVRALLACLAWRPGKARSREKLATLLWGDRPEEHARHSLSQALTTVRQAAGAELVHSDGEQLYLDPDSVVVDAVRLRALAREGTRAALEEAATLCTAGEFLEGLEIGAREFDDWLRDARAEVDEVRAAVHEDLLDHALASGDARRSTELARALLAEDPLNERAHRGLMHAHALLGQPERSLRQYDECHERLAQELAIDPDDETQRLAQAIRARAIPTSESSVPNAPDRSATPPIIVVVPFTAIGNGDGKQHLANGLAHDLITELTRFRSLQVIAKDTAFKLPSGFGAATGAAREIGASYVLTGSLERMPNSARIEARLVDTGSGVHVWGERYDVQLEEFFEVRDDVVASIVGTVAPLVDRDRVRLTHCKPTSSWDAYDYFLRAWEIYFTHWSSPIPPPECRPLLEHAIELDPGFARAHALLACVSSHTGKEGSADEDFSEAIGHGRRAMALDPREAQAPRVLGAIYTLVRRYEEARHQLWHALRLNPNDADLAVHEARYHALMGEAERAFGPFERARRLNPLHPGWYWSVAAMAHHVKGDYAAAVAATERLDEKSFIDYLYAAACHAELGDPAAARRAVHQALAAQPGVTVANVGRYLPYRDDADREHVLRGLAKAGLPA